MNYKFLLCLFFLPITTLSAMETLPTDIIVYQISPELNRFTKNSYRCINKKFSELIIPQDILNENYAIAKKNDNHAMMVEWRKKGALDINKEVYNIFTENKKLSAKMLWFMHTNTPEPFCIKSAFTHGITMNNKLFIMFLLEEAKPSHNSDVITNAIVHSKTLKYSEFIQIFQEYIEQNQKPKHPYCYGIGGYEKSFAPPAY